MNQPPSSCSCRTPFAAFLVFLMLALLSIIPALSCPALLRTVSSDQCCLSCLGWLLCHQVGPGSLRSSFYGTVLHCSFRNVCDFFLSTKNDRVVGDHDVAAVLPWIGRYLSPRRHASAWLLPVSSPPISCHCLLMLSSLLSWPS